MYNSDDLENLKSEISDTEWNDETAIYVCGYIAALCSNRHITLEQFKELKRLIPLKDSDANKINF